MLYTGTNIFMWFFIWTNHINLCISKPMVIFLVQFFECLLFLQKLVIPPCMFESTLCWHFWCNEIILFSWVVHFWVNTMTKLRRNFTIFCILLGECIIMWLIFKIIVPIFAKCPFFEHIYKIIKLIKLRICLEIIFSEKIQITLFFT
jgi:hypothetical protein